MYKFLFLLNIALFFSTVTWAQPESVVRLVANQPADCTNNIIYVDIELRALTPADTFRVGAQNYRFSFDRYKVENPVIETELVLSGIVIDTTNTLSVYSSHDLTGSLDTIVSYNLKCGVGLPGYLVTTDWLPIGRVAFDMLPAEGCAHFIVHNNTKFPPTFVGAVIPGGFDGTNVNTQNLSVCFEDICPVSTTSANKEADWTIFPNPVGNIANLQLEQQALTDKSVEVEVIDVSGKLVYRQVVFNNTFSTANLSPGLYMVRLKTANWQSEIQKFVKE